MKKKLKMKKSFKLGVGLLFIIGIVILVPVVINGINISKLTSLDYSIQASQRIVDLGLLNRVLDEGYSAVYDDVVLSDDYDDDNFELYFKVDYVLIDNLAKHINDLNEIGYSPLEISYIIKSGNSEDVSNFSKLAKQRDVLDLLEYDYAILANYERYVSYQLETRERDQDVVRQVNLNLDKPYYENANIIDNYSIDMLLNKYNQVNENYVPDELMTIKSEYTVDTSSQYQLSREAVLAFEKMVEAALSAGYTILANSAYRSYLDQQETYDFYLEEYGQSYVDNYVAVPGFSEHQTGLALDIASGTGNIFKETKEFSWMLDNCYKYGYIYRYPAAKEMITGYSNEAWHYRYVGVDIATYIYENSITFDEYYVMFLEQ